MKKIPYLLLIVGFAVMASASSKVQASSIDSAVKNLDSSLSQLITAKDDLGSDKQLSPEEDLAFRKKIVSDALTLSIKEIEDVRSKLNAFKFDDKSAENSVKKLSLTDLGEFESYYRDLQGRLDKEDNIEKIKDIARSAKSYREETYSPIISKILDFILAFQTDRLVISADIRYGKIEADIRKLERANFIESGYFGRQMSEAKKFISDAKGLTEKAKIAVTAKPEEEKTEDQDIASQEIIADKKQSPTPRELSEAALVNLKSGYNIFVDISGAVKKILKI